MLHPLSTAGRASQLQRQPLPSGLWHRRGPPHDLCEGQGAAGTSAAVRRQGEAWGSHDSHVTDQRGCVGEAGGHVTVNNVRGLHWSAFMHFIANIYLHDYMYGVVCTRVCVIVRQCFQ